MRKVEMESESERVRKLGDKEIERETEMGGEKGENGGESEALGGRERREMRNVQAECKIGF